MPLYEYFCGNCGRTSEVLRAVEDRQVPVICPLCMRGRGELIASVPAAITWDQHRAFENCGTRDPVSFETRKAYENHLKEKGIAEASTSAPKKHRSCAQVTVYGSHQTERGRRAERAEDRGSGSNP